MRRDKDGSSENGNPPALPRTPSTPRIPYNRPRRDDRRSPQSKKPHPFRNAVVATSNATITPLDSLDPLDSLAPLAPQAPLAALHLLVVQVSKLRQAFSRHT